MWPFSKRKVQEKPIQPQYKYDVGQWVEFKYCNKILKGIIRHRNYDDRDEFNKYEITYNINPNGWRTNPRVGETDVLWVTTPPEKTLDAQYDYWITFNPKCGCPPALKVEQEPADPLDRPADPLGRNNSCLGLNGYIDGIRLKKFSSKKEAYDYLFEHDKKICKMISDNKCLSVSALVEKIRRKLEND